MITVDSGKKYFYLTGKRYSYVMFVNEWGYLQTLHFGKKTGIDDLTYLKDLDFKSFSPTPPDILIEGISLDLMPREFAGFGQGDFRSPTALIERDDGSCFSRFKYKRYEIMPAAPDLGDLPHARTGQGAETLIIWLRDECSGIEVKLSYTTFNDNDVLVRGAEYVNNTDSHVMLKKAFSFCVDLPARDFDLLHFSGRHLQERVPERTPLHHGLFRVSSERGASSHETNPAIALLGQDATEEHGDCYLFNLIYSGSFAVTAERSQTDSVRVQGGINDFAFSWRLGAGETFTVPQVAIVYSDKGLGGASREMSDFTRDHLIGDFAFQKRPVVINNWEATAFDFDTKKLLSFIDEASSLGVDMFVLDDGWFGHRDDDCTSLGDWVVNETKLPGGLSVLIDHCKKKGLSFGLWFEPEMISKDSDLYRAHPDWAIGKAGVERCRSRNQYVLDFTRDEVVNAVYDMMHAILSRYDISYVKWDMNRNITENFSAPLGADGQGEFSHRYILGVYRLARRLREAFPDVLFEGCSGGGGRFDAGMLYYFPQIWTSDDTDGFERSKIQYATSICYPLSAMSCHVSVCPNQHTGRVLPFSTRGHIASLGATGYELDPTKLSKEEKQLAKEQIASYKKIQDLILSGDCYRLLSPFESNYFCMMVVSKDKSLAYLVGEEIHSTPDDVNRRLRLTGLNEEARYEIEESGLALSGKTLMGAGLVLPHLKDFTSWTWTFRKI